MQFLDVIRYARFVCNSDLYIYFNKCYTTYIKNLSKEWIGECQLCMHIRFHRTRPHEQWQSKEHIATNPFGCSIDKFHITFDLCVFGAQDCFVFVAVVALFVFSFLVFYFGVSPSKCCSCPFVINTILFSNSFVLFHVVPLISTTIFPPICNQFKTR